MFKKPLLVPFVTTGRTLMVSILETVDGFIDLAFIADHKPLY
jgi:hypothetical protein